MEKYHARFFVCHVLVNGNDVDLVLTQRFQDRLQFVFRHREVAINNALSSLPANAAHVFTPMSLPILMPCIVAGLLNVNFTIPSFDSPCAPKISFRGAALIEFFSGNGAGPHESFGFGFPARIFSQRRKLF